MTITINVQTSLNIASRLRQKSFSNSNLNEILDLEREFGITLKPLHPNTSDPNLAKHFIVKVDNMTIAEKVISRLLKIKYVEGAYIKPPDQLPQ